MPQVVGKIPDFTDGDAPEVKEEEEVKEPSVEETEEEKDTPSDLPAEEKPVEEDLKPQDEDAKANQGLLTERQKLLVEIQDLRKERRDIKGKKEPIIVKQKDDLDDIDPEYAQTIERVIKAKGYITKEESSKLSYDSIKKGKLDEFLEKYPEYKPENDSNDVNWNSLQKELSFYKMPNDPHLFERVLKKAHNAILKPAQGGRTTKIKTARLGSGGEKRPSSQAKHLTEAQKNAYRNGGWSEEEITDLET